MQKYMLFCCRAKFLVWKIEEGKDRERMEEEQDETWKEDSEKGEDRKAEEEEKGRSEKEGMTVFISINFNNLHALLETVPHIIRKQSKL